MLSRAARRAVQTFVFLGLPATAVPGAAEPGPADAAALAWHCEQQFDAGFHVFCTPQSQAPGAAAATAVQAEAPTTAPARWAAEKLPVAQRGDAEVHSAPAWRVPLHARPAERERVEELLQSVLCGARPGCAVHYDPVSRRVAGR